jgi:Mlc titration factor MtfA (ptsG expression regulator)
MLEKKVLFYIKLIQESRHLFEKRVQRFLATKNIEGVDAEIDDAIRLMVAASAIIPTFAFPAYNYPNPTSF